MRIDFSRLSRLAAITLVTLGIVSDRVDAWGNKEHIQFTRLAAMRIVNDPAAPEDLKSWLKANTELLPSMEAEREFFLTASFGKDVDPAKVSGLLWWSVVPDIKANDRGAGNNGSFGNRELTSHFIDLEFFNAEPTKRTYRFDLSSLPPIEAMPYNVTFETYKRAGYLPFAREEAYKRLVDSIRANKLAADPAKPDDDHAVRWAAYLAHYTQDNTQPQHATMDYQGALYFKGMRNAPNVHNEVEWRMADADKDPQRPQLLPELRADFWPLFAKELERFKDTTVSDDPFTSTLEVSRESYLALPLIGTAAQQSLKEKPTDPAKPEIDTEKFFRFVGEWKGQQASVMQMKAHQTAWAVVRTERVLRQAWAEAKSSPAPTP